jgi:hypothetical protein
LLGVTLSLANPLADFKKALELRPDLGAGRGSLQQLGVAP